MPYELRVTFLLAMIISFLLIVFIIFVIYTYNKRQLLFKTEQELQKRQHDNEVLRLELEKRNAILKERTRISHDMHDDLGAGISALKLQAEFLKLKVKNQPDLIQDIQELLTTSEEMNLSMREMLWSLNNQNDTLQNFTTYTIKHVKSFMEKTPIKLKIVKEGLEPHIEINSLIRRNLFLCVKESFNNIYKHSQAENAELLLIFYSPSLKISVIDDGIGFPEELVIGNGLKNMAFRMKDINGDFNWKSTEEMTELHFKVSLNNQNRME